MGRGFIKQVTSTKGYTRWKVAVHVGRNKYRWGTFPTKREAEAWAARMMGEVNSGGVVPSPKLTYAEFAQAWMEKILPNKALTTQQRYRHTIMQRFLPALGHLPLVKISTAVIDGYIAQESKQGRHPNTLRVDFKLLSSTFRQAVRWDLLSRNPCSGVSTLPATQKYKSQPWDESELKMFLAEAKRRSPYFLLYKTAIFSGMRSGELLGLTYKCIDRTGTIHVEKSLKRVNKEWHHTETKTESSKRAISVPLVLVDELLATRGDREETDLVFQGPDGAPQFRQSVLKDMGRITTRLKLSKQRFHDLRHYHLSALIHLGHNVLLIQQRAGHASSRTTLDIYGHVFKGADREAADAFSKHLNLGS